MSWFSRLPRDSTAAERGPSFAGVAAAVLWMFAVAFALGAAQVWRALHSGRAWSNYRGELMAPKQMQHTFVFLIVVTVLCVLLALRFQRFVRRGR
jgi:hypothetical protein